MPTHNRWLVLASSLQLLIVAGGVYGFGTLAADLKQALGISESQKEFIGVCGNAGLWTGSAAGGYLADRYGAKQVIRGAAILLGVGYFVMYCALRNAGEAWVSGYSAGAGWLLVGHGSGWVYNGSLFVSASNFGERDRSHVLGMLAMSFGMASTVYATVLHGCIGGSVQETDQEFSCEHGFPGGDVQAYMGLMSILVPVVTLILSCWTVRLEPDQVHKLDQQQSGSRWHWVSLVPGLVILTYVVACNAARLTASSTQWQAQLQLVSTPVLGAALVGWFLVVCFPRHGAPQDFEAVETAVDPRAPTAVAMTVSEAWLTPDFWLLVVTIGSCVGSNVTVMNNLTTIVKDRGSWDDLDQVGNMSVIVVMSVSAVTRVGVGVMMHQVTIPKGCYLIASACLAVVAQIAMCIDIDSFIFLGCILIGLSDGALWTSAPWVVGKIFGLKHNGAIFGGIVCSGAVVVVALSYGVEPAVYNAHKSDGSECDGIRCFLWTHYICACVSAFGVAATLALHRSIQGHEDRVLPASLCSKDKRSEKLLESSQEVGQNTV